MKKEVVVTVDLAGKVEVSAEGFKGKGCEAATKFIEDELGIDGKNRKRKPEYNQSETVSQKQNA